jgi:hypothetical protein
MIARCLKAPVRFFAVRCELCGKSSGAAGHWSRGTTSASPSSRPAPSENAHCPKFPVPST